ncbi:MAG: helix-turn-helix domain-containing protein [Phycisphaeraceae bacterium]
MAKMFYTLEEAAAKLGVAPDKIKDMAGSGQIQQFRDRDKLMFKRDQIDAMANETDLDEGADASGGPIALADTSAGIGLEDSVIGSGDSNAGSGSGVNVFEGGEVNEADPLAQTQLTDSDLGDDLNLEPSGSSSGSGLLDLTNESDDTSLGAELLDEIYPGSDAGDTSIQTAEGSGMFGPGASGSGTAMTTTMDSGGFGALGEVSAVEPQAGDMELGALAAASSGGGSTRGEDFLSGSLFGVIVTLVVALLVIVPVWAGSSSPITVSMMSSAMFYGIWLGGLFIAWVLFGVIGMVLGGRG